MCRIVTDDGRLYIWGRPYDFSNLLRINSMNKFSSLLSRFVSKRTNLFTINSDDTEGGLYMTPRLMGEELGEKIVSANSSAGVTIGLTMSGQVFCFGLNQWGQCGSNETNDQMHVLKPRKIFTSNTQGVTRSNHIDSFSFSMPRAFKQVDVGLQHCVALSDDGIIYSWGKGSRGQLGDGKGDSSSVPVIVSLDHFVSSKARKAAIVNNSISIATSICAGFNFTAALSSDGSVYVWGKGMSLDIKSVVMGLNVYEDQLTPRKIELPEGRKVMEVCNSSFTCVMRADDKTLWTFGVGEYDRITVCVPIQVQKALPYIEYVVPESIDSKPFAVPPPVSLPVTAALKKGYKRVSVIVSDKNDGGIVHHDVEASSSIASTVKSGVYEVVLHAGEAFLKELEDVPDAQIVDYSSGWMHSLILHRTVK